MSDQELRRLERAWLAAQGDDALLGQLMEHARRAGLDPVLHLADLGGAAPWAAALRASQPVLRDAPGGPILGRRLRVLVRNGDHFQADLSVYDDGALMAWDPMDRAELARTLADPRAHDGPPVVTSAPNSARWSMHALGGGTLAGGCAWPLKARDLLTAVDLLLRAPAEAGRPRVTPDALKVVPLRAIPYRPVGRQVVRGIEMPVLVRGAASGALRLASWVVYADGLTHLDPCEPVVPVEDVARRIEGGAVTTRPGPDETCVEVPGLATLRLGPDSTWHVEPGERIREAHDALDILAGRAGAIERCRAALAEHEALVAGPRMGPRILEASRERLRAEYEAIPRHMRRFVGDMDSKDGRVRELLGLDD